MKSLLPFATIASCAILTAFAPLRIAVAQKAIPSDAAHDFRTSHSCITCHNNLKTAKGEDISFASAWSASMLANAAYDPYWQGSVRRESVDHPEVNSAIQTECASCHMPLQYLRDKAQGHETQVFSRLPLSGHRDENDAAIEGVTCTVCHQIQPKGLGTPETANGKFTVSPGGTVPRPVFGPFGEAPDRVVAIHLNSSGYAPKSSTHIRDAALCGTCHTLYTTAFGPGGKEIGRLPEQMTYLEWQQSSFKETKTCQECHMPPVEEQAKIATAFSTPHDGVHRHTFVGANFFMQQMLNAHHDELGVDASTGALTEAAVRTTA